MAYKKKDQVDANLRYFYETILRIETIEECEAIFDDLCTKTELASISQRLVVAKMLDDRKVYSDIVAQTGASTATISRVNRCLQYGDGGYSLALDNKDAGAE